MPATPASTRKRSELASARAPAAAGGRGAVDRLLALGPVAFCLVASAFGILEVHSSTDTWIGLAAGRQILTSPTFPKADTFSYTFYGSTWYNQNWLTHVWQYWLYDTFGPNAVIYGTWAMALAIFALVLVSTYWLTRNWGASLVAAGIVGFGCRDFVSARPATTGFFLMAAGFAIICALESGAGRRAGGRRPWWPIALILPLLVIWGNAHGSFIFGYGIFGLYLLHWATGWLAARIGSPSDQRHEWLGISARQAAWIAVMMVAAFVITWQFGPFGFDNFTHGEKIRGSDVFRRVSEWKSPLTNAPFPPVWRFWLILGLGVLAVVAAVLMRALYRGAARDQDATQKKPDAARPAADERRPLLLARVFRSLALYHIAMITLALVMTLWARRFAPILYIFGTPVVCAVILALVRRAERWLPVARRGVQGTAWLAACAVGFLTVSAVWDTLVEPSRQRPEATLLDLVTRYDSTPHDAILYLQKNEVSVNLLTEWTQGGMLMFYTPNVRLFIDGRAQQLYDEGTYRDMESLMGLPIGDLPAAQVERIGAHVASVLYAPSRAPAMPDGARTDAVLVRRSQSGLGLWQALDNDPTWVNVYLGYDSVIFLRRDSDAFRAIARSVLEGREWRPQTASAVAALGNVYLAMKPEQTLSALECYRRAVEMDPMMGVYCYRAIAATLVNIGQASAARQFLQQQRERLMGPDGQRLSPMERASLLQILDRCEREVNRRLWRTTGSQPTGGAASDRTSPATQRADKIAGGDGD